MMSVTNEHNAGELGSLINHYDFGYCDRRRAFQAREYTLYEEVFAHHPSLDTLRKSAEQGCEMCRVLLAGFSEAEDFLPSCYDEFKDSEAIALKMFFNWPVRVRRHGVSRGNVDSSGNAGSLDDVNSAGDAWEAKLKVPAFQAQGKATGASLEVRAPRSSGRISIYIVDGAYPGYCT